MFKFDCEKNICTSTVTFPVAPLELPAAVQDSLVVPYYIFWHNMYSLASIVLSAVMSHSHTAALMCFMTSPGSCHRESPPLRLPLPFLTPLKVFIYHMYLGLIASKLSINCSKSVLYYSPAIENIFPCAARSSAGQLSSFG